MGGVETGAAALGDLPLDQLRVALAPAIAEAAVFDGWSGAALDMAADQHGLDRDVVHYAFKGGQQVMIGAWIKAIDHAMEEALPAAALAGTPIRERIRRLVQFRLDQAEGKEEALSRALSIMAQPQNAGFALRRGWASADRMWRLAGDNATDYNHYTKRAILASIYAATLTVYATDTSAGKAESRAFLDRRIKGVMRFEKAKARLLNSEREHFSVTRFLGRLRYPAR